jgi:sialate O-acetylesterase
MRLSSCLFFIVFFIFSNDLLGQIRVPPLFSDNMVLPRNKTFPIEGTATPNEALQIEIQDQKHLLKVASDGTWKVLIKPLKIGKPITLKIQGEEELLELKNVLVGDLWLCSGQSNMQYTLDMLKYVEEKNDRTDFENLRLFTVGIEMDYLPKKEVKGSGWKIADAKTARSFSATALFFGRYLADNQEVPIGLISSNMGATTIETWMSVDALKTFPQFDEVTNDILKTNKNFETLDKELAQFRIKWDKEHYLVGEGMDEKWYAANYDDRDWETAKTPLFWEYLGHENHDGSFWFRKTFDLDSNQLKQDLILPLNQIDDYDITWVNGQKVGETFGNRNFRTYFVPKEILKEKNNQICIRVFDIGGLGGIYTSAFWGNPILNGTWKYKKGRAIDIEKFPIPKVANASLFSHPSVLYNVNIAPLHSLPIAGTIWYQGESNEARAVEYEQLLKAMIRDWRKKWKQPELPFLIVQLANYKKEDTSPENSNWAELRAAQFAATQLPRVDIVTAIDIGDAADIHPYNKKEVGRRLGLLAMHYAYGKSLQKSPIYQSNRMEGNQIYVQFKGPNLELKCNNKFGYLRGFAIADETGKFHWAKAFISGKNEVVVYSNQVQNPKYVRYAWSDNPGPLDLYDANNLPVLPFRTDQFELGTAQQKFKYDPHGF